MMQRSWSLLWRLGRERLKRPGFLHDSDHVRRPRAGERLHQSEAHDRDVAAGVLEIAHSRVRQLEMGNAALNLRLMARPIATYELESALWRLQALHASVDISH